MAALITLEEAKRHLRITHANADADITAKLEAASDIIHDYMDDRDDPEWTTATVPLVVKHAVYLHLTHLYEHRGDDMNGDEDLWMATDRLLVRLRPPTTA